jgi:hypothetical protein
MAPRVLVSLAAEARHAVSVPMVQVRDIAHSGDVSGAIAGDDRYMLIELVIEQKQPLLGRAVVDHDERRFEGWLQLLSILSQLVEKPD